MEPTHRQHLILEAIEKTGGKMKNSNDKDIEPYWELVRSGYLRNLVMIGGSYDWRFTLTDKAEEYLKSF